MKIHYSNHISWQLLDNKIYVIDEINGKVHILEEVSKDFWILIKDKNSLEEIIKILSERYIVSNDILINDINELTDMLLSENLIEEGDFYHE